MRSFVAAGALVLATARPWLKRRRRRRPRPASDDWPAMARLVVDRWQLKPGERGRPVLGAHGRSRRRRRAPHRDRGQGRRRRGLDRRRRSAGRRSLGPGVRAGRRRGSCSLTNARFDDRPFEHLWRRARVRSIHFHWFLPPSPAHHDAIDAMYRTGLSRYRPRPCSTASSHSRRRSGAPRCVISTPLGTMPDARRSLPAARFHRNSGRRQPGQGEGRALGTRSREEFPAVLRTTDLRR